MCVSLMCVFCIFLCYYCEFLLCVWLWCVHFLCCVFSMRPPPPKLYSLTCLKRSGLRCVQGHCGVFRETEINETEHLENYNCSWSKFKGQVSQGFDIKQNVFVDSDLSELF